jgi:ArsR family transcriptional regulator
MKKHLPVIACCTPLAGSSLSDQDAIELEQLFKVLADRNRVKILNILLRARGQAVCVCEFTDQLDLAQPTVSYHLKLLREAGLLDREKRGTFAYFGLRPEAMERLHSLVEPVALAKAV